MSTINALLDVDLLNTLEIPNHAVVLIQHDENSDKYCIRQCGFIDGTVVTVSPWGTGAYTRLFIEESLAKKYIEDGTKFDRVCHCSGHLCSRKNANAKFRECITDWSI